MIVKMHEQVSDISRETLVAWKRGSVKAFEEIVRSSMKRAYSVALGIVGNVEDARDISQECFMAAHKARKSFDVDRPFRVVLPDTEKQVPEFPQGASPAQRDIAGRAH